MLWIIDVRQFEIHWTRHLSSFVFRARIVFFFSKSTTLSSTEFLTQSGRSMGYENISNEHSICSRFSKEIFLFYSPYVNAMVIFVLVGKFFLKGICSPCVGTDSKLLLWNFWFDPWRRRVVFVLFAFAVPFCFLLSARILFGVNVMGCIMKNSKALFEATGDGCNIVLISFVLLWSLRRGTGRLRFTELVTIPFRRRKNVIIQVAWETLLHTVAEEASLAHPWLHKPKINWMSAWSKILTQKLERNKRNWVRCGRSSNRLIWGKSLVFGFHSRPQKRQFLEMWLVVDEEKGFFA